MIKVVIALSVLSILNAYVVIRVIGRNRMPLWLALAFFGLQLLGPFGDRLLFPILKRFTDVTLPFTVLDWLSYLALGLLACLFLYGLVADLARVIWNYAAKDSTVNFERRALLTLGGATLGTTVIGVGQAVAGPSVRMVTIPLKGLPPSFDGFKIAQISDLHVGPMIGRDYTQNVVSITNGLAPDLVALTGDFVDGSVEQLKDDVAPLADLKSVHGSYYITGNHEYYWGAAPWIAEFKRLGARVLSNDHVLIRRSDDRFILAGIPDLSTLRNSDIESASAEQALQGSPDGLVKILLAHQPNSYDMASKAGFDLQISGHTHAGQFFPFSPFIRFFQRYYQGLNRHENLWIYVNSGTGYWGPPLRTAVPSEITLITLRSETV